MAIEATLSVPDRFPFPPGYHQFPFMVSAG